MSTRVLVLGGGLAGLLAARRHARGGARVTLVERREDVGGAVRGVDLGDLVVNAGAEAYGTASGAVDALLRDLGLDERVVSPRAGLGSRVVSEAGALGSPPGGLLGIPGDPLSREVRAALGTTGALRAWAERLLPASYGFAEGVSVAEYVRRRMGARVAERLVAPIIGGVHSADPHTLELASVLPRLEETVRETGSLAAAVRRLRPQPHASAGTAVRALDPTMALLPGALADDLLSHGGTMLSGTRAVGVRWGSVPPEGADATDLQQDGTDAAWQVRLEGAHAGTLAADHLVIATDPGTARDLLLGNGAVEVDGSDAGADTNAGADTDADHSLAEVARAIPPSPAVAVRLVLLALEAPELDSFPSGTGALVAPGTRGIRAKGLTHASAKWEHVERAARERFGPHAHVLRLSYGRPGEVLPGDDALTDEQVTDLALADASAILGTALTREQLRAARTVTWRRTMRQARPGHRAALEDLDRILGSAGLPLELTGAWRAGTGLDALVRHDGRTS
ncbi:protoporphyrinogen/coproporphyrinogen oxidase [Brachybacterium kimchii]|uniref:FAD-dependent oxidoreductase n=1 Tax=Brachybacterium kimchii TaxID=2942909 RepID=A0ABY4N0P1_9MICO|nr:FAD-dependent oxidoreductase [Brachybacterium kimchii]UQN28124.1 FAD-dependent oxidoreductase [Brachybacterium kimchii]